MKIDIEVEKVGLELGKRWVALKITYHDQDGENTLGFALDQGQTLSFHLDAALADTTVKR